MMLTFKILQALSFKYDVGLLIETKDNELCQKVDFVASPPLVIPERI